MNSNKLVEIDFDSYLNANGHCGGQKHVWKPKVAKNHVLDRLERFSSSNSSTSRLSLNHLPFDCFPGQIEAEYH